MSKPANAKGTRDFSSIEVRKRKFIFDTIIDVYTAFGFEPLETPALENIETLTGKYGDEGDQLLFRVLRSGNYLQKASDEELSRENINKLRSKITDKGLRYDLTIPFARFVAKNHQEIGLPYKRYQIQPVWRADRPAKGRYREFYQCDADVVGTNSLLADSEFMLIIDSVFHKLNMPRVTTHLNNRKVLYGIAENHGITDKFVPMTVALDKLDKVGIDGVKKELAQRDFSEAEIDDVTSYLNIEGDNAIKLHLISERFTNTETGQKGVSELRELLTFVNQSTLEHSSVEVNFALARGLSYYTGSIYEVTLNGVDMGSVASGGRYDDLTGVFGLKDVPGVGMSFGAERIYDVMEQLNLFPENNQLGLAAYFTNMGGDAEMVSFGLMNRFRKEGVSCDMYPSSVKMGKQFKHADKRQARYAVVVGEDEMKADKMTLKNLKTGEQSLVNFEEALHILKS